MKKGLIKAGVAGFLCLAFFCIIFFSLFSSAYSNKQEIPEDYTLFTFQENQSFVANTTILFDFVKQGNYKIMIMTPSGERISRISSNDNFFLKLEEEGEYYLSIERGNGKKFYGLFVISSEQEPPEEPKPNPEDPVQEKAEINKPVEWTQTISEENLTNLIEIPPVINLTLTDNTGEEINYTLITIEGKNYINLTESLQENISGKIKIDYTTEPPKVEETIISETVKEIVVSSPENISYTNVLSYTSLPREISDLSLVQIYWREQDTYLDFVASDTNNNGLFDFVEWNVPHLSTQTFEIIVITKAEHLDSNKNFLSDIYAQVKELDDSWSETINAEEYVRVTFEIPLNNTRDITVFPRIISGDPTIEIYESNGTEKIAEFSSLMSNEYNKVYLTSLVGEQDTFDLKIKGGSLQFDHIIDPQINYNVNSSMRAYWGRPTASSRWSAGTNSTSSQYANLATEDGVYARNVMTAGTSNDYPFYRFNFTINENISWITSIYVKFTGYDNASETGTVYLWRFRNSTWMPIGTTPAANGNVTRNLTSDFSNYTDSNNQFIVLWEGAAYDAGDAVIIDEVKLIVQYLDRISPTFSNIPQNASIFYGNESLGVDFDATDETEFGYYSVNDTRFSINQSGFLRNSTILGTGNYSLNITINDSSNNINWTLYRLEIKKFSSPCSVYFNTSSPRTYPEQFRVYTNCSPDYNIFMNGSSIANNSLINSGAGYFNFTAERQENENYTYYSDTKFFRINENSERYDVLFNVSSPIFYPETFRVYTNSSSAFTLYRNGTIIGNNSEQSNGAGYFVYLSQRVDEQNYSWINDQDFFTVFKSQEFCTVLFNESFPLSDKNSFLVWTNCSGQSTLYRNGTLIENNSEQFLSSGVYNFSFLRVDIENYSQIYNEKQAIIQDTTYPLIDFGVSSPQNNSKFARDWIYIDADVVEENEENITFNLYFSNYTLFNSSTYFDKTRKINWTNLPEGTYYFNISVFDHYGYFNSTSTRKTTLNLTLPSIYFVQQTLSNGVSVNRNWIYANVSSTNLNQEINITFGLYNDSGLLNQSIYTDSRRQINWTNLPEGTYYYNVTLFDNPDGRVYTLTRIITLDSSPSNITNDIPEDNSIVSSSSQIMVAEISDNLGLSNFTLNIYNETSLANSTFQEISGLYALTNIFYNLPYEGVFKWNYLSFDLAGNSFLTSNFTLVYDLTYPLIDYLSPTPDENKSIQLNFIYVNVSIIEENLANITFDLYDTDYNLINSSTYFDSRREINWTDLLEGMYYFNVTIVDLANNYNYTSTRQVILDLTSPNATLLSPENDSLLSDSNQNLTVNASDNLGLANMTLFVYNQTDLINETTQDISGTEIITGIVYNFMYDGIFKWFYKIFDLAGNSFETENNTITIDTTAPMIDYGSGTPVDFANISHNWIYISASLNEPNFKNITFNLYFSNYTLLNSSTYIDSRRQINWTNISDGDYYYNITSFDLLNHSNTTLVRTINIDTSNPNLYTRAGTTSYTAGTPVQISFANEMLDADYSVLFSGQQDTDAVFSIQYDNKATTGFRINRVHDDGGANESAGIEWAALSFGEFDFQNISVKCNSGSGSSTSTINFESSFPDSNYAIVAFSPWDDDSPRVSYSSKAAGSWGSVILDDGGAAEAVSSIDWCAVSYGTETIGNINIKAGYNTTSGATSKVISLGSSFPNTNYVVLTTATRTGTADPCEIEVSGKTTTSFSVTAEDDDTTNNCNGREFNWIAISTGEFVVDTTPPDFTFIPVNASLFYGNESLGVDFDATDETEFGYYSVNDTRFSINQSGFLTNSTPLKVGNYDLNITINDTSNNINWIIYNIKILQSKSNCLIYFNESSPMTYPAVFRVYTNCNSDYNLTINGTQISNNSIINSGATAYNLSVSRIDTENYTNIFHEREFIILKNPELCQVLFNVSFPLESSTPFLVWGNCSSQFNLYLNGAPVENNSVQTLLLGVYNFSLLRLDAINYSFYYNETQAIMEDTIFPLIDFGISSPQNNSKFARDWIYIDAEVLEENEENITFNLYNSNNVLLNSSTYIDSRRQINWTNLPEGIYYFNISIFDAVLHFNSTSTRQIKLNFSLPSINFVSPTEENSVFRKTDWIYINVSTSNVNEEINITFGLYNDSGLLNQSIYTDSRRQINWTNLPEGIYYYNVTLFDDLDGIIPTLTRQITLDVSFPNATLISPENNTYSNSTQHNLGLSASDNLGLANMTLFVYNQTDLINETTQDISGTEIITGIVYNFMYDGIFKWFYKIFDLAGNSFETENNTITIDTTYSLIDFVYPTEENYFNKSQNFIYVNVSVLEINEANITFDLYDAEYTLINSSTYFDSRREINWTELYDGIYYYNITIVDLANNYNYTSTRQIGLDTHGPSIVIVDPDPKAYGINENLPLNYNVFDEISGVSTCWWNLDNSVNLSIPCNTNTTFDTTEGPHTIYVYSNDSFNQLSMKSVSFYVSLTGPAIILNSPSDFSYLNSQANIFFNYSALDPDGVDSCSLYGNWTGLWMLNKTDLDWVVVKRKSFFDNFESQTFDNWTNTAWTIASDFAEGVYSSKCATGANCDMYSASPIEVYTPTEINLTFRYRDDDCDAGDVILYFNDSSGNWDNMGNINAGSLGGSEDTWNNAAFSTTDSQYLHSGFAIRFWADPDTGGGGSSENYWIDNINLTYNSREFIQEGIANFSVNLSSDGSYIWNVQCNDSFGYPSFAFKNNTFTIDTTYPIIDYSSGTELNNSNKSSEYIYVNVSVIESNEANITFNLYDSNYNLLNSSTYQDKRREIIWESLVDGTYFYNVTIADYVNQYNTTLTRKINLDTTFPYFTYIPPNASIFYRNESLGVDFDATDNIEFGYYLVNDTRFSINQSGFLRNSTILGAGNYSLNITINDSSNNLNWTIYKVQVNKSTYFDCGGYFNTTSPIIYPEIFTVYTNCSSAYTLYRNGTSISNNSVIRSGAGYYNITVRRTDTQNYTNTFSSEFFTVDKNPENCEVLFNASSPIIYPETFSTWTNCSTPFTLRRNNTIISNNSIINSGASVYNISFLRTDTQNYSKIYGESFFTINKATPTGNISSSAGWDLNYPTSTTISYTESNLGDTDVQYVIYRNNSNRGSGETITLGAGFYNYILNTTGGANYTLNSSLDMKNLTVNKNPEFCQIFFNETSPIDYPSTFLVWGNCSTPFTLRRNSTIISNNSEQKLLAGFYNFSFLRTDTQNYSLIYNESYFTINRDLENPYFTYIPPNASIFYRNESLGVDFDATDNIEFGYYSVNDTRFSINQSGFLRNSTILGAGNYSLNITINDSSNNINWTVYSVQVNKSTYFDCGVYFNTTSPITYPEIFTVYTNCSSAYTLYRNGTSISNNSVIRSGAGYYNITVRRTDTQNYTNTFSSEFFTINKNPEEFNVIFNASSPINYPDIFLVWANSTTPFTLRRNNTIISNNSIQNNGAGYFNFSAQRTDTSNYSFIYNQSFFTVNKAIDSCSVYFNTTSPITYPENFIAYTNCSTNYNLYLNGTSISNNSVVRSGAGYYNITVRRTDTANYTNILDTKFFTINRNPEMCQVLFNDSSPLEYPKTFLVWANCTSPFTLYRNGSIIINNTEQALLIGDYNFSMLRDDGTNYTFYYNQTQIRIIDITNPNATLISPENNTFTSITTHNLTVNATDNYGLSNMTLFVYNQTHLINQTTQEISGTEIITGIVYNFIYDGIFKWFYKIFDVAGNSLNTVNNTITIDTTSPVVSLIFPYNGKVISNSSVWFTGNFSEANNLVNVTFYLWNSTNDLINMTSINITGNSNSTNLSVILPYYDAFKWNYLACDNLSNCALNSTNYSLEYELPEVGISVLYPLEDINVAKNKFFNITLNVTCFAGECGTVNVSLDPISWWDSSWIYRKQINITNNNATSVLESGYSFNITLDTTGDKFLDNGDDIRIVYYNGTSNIELDRINTTSFNSSSTILWFKLQNNISASSVDSNYSVYYGNSYATNPPTNKSNIYLFYDNFTDSSAWSTFSGACSASSSQGNPIPSLFMSGSGTTDRCYATNFNLPSTPYLIEADVYISSTGGRGIRNIGFKHTTSHASGYMYRLQTSGGDGGFFTLSGTGTWAKLGSNDADVSADTWHNLRLLVRGTNFTAWVNGNYRNSVVSSTYSNTKIGTQDDGGADTDSYVDNYIVRRYIYPNPSSSLGNEETGIKTGLVSMIPGTIPFYTNISNPYTTSYLNRWQSETIVFYVNATGAGTHTFFAFANLTKDLSINDTTLTWNVTIDITPPELTIISPSNQSYDSSSLDFNISANEPLSSCKFTFNNWLTNYTMNKFNSTYFYYTNTSMNDNIYTVKFSCIDLAGNINNSENINFTVDAYGPNINLTTPLNNTYNNNNLQNLSFSASDSVGLKNATIYIFNSSGNLINFTNIFISGKTILTGIIYTFTYDGIFTWFYKIFDIANNEKTTQNNTLIIDTKNPLISYGSGTELNFANVSQNWIYINITLNETNFANLTFKLYNGSTGNLLFNQTTYNDSRRTINWTNLQEGLYWYNVTVTDLALNKNTTSTQQIRLDASPPEIKLVFPNNLTYGYNITLLSYTLYDPLIDQCWYSINDSSNTSITCGQNISTFLNDGTYTWKMYSNDTLGHLGLSNVSFKIDTDIPAVIIHFPENITYNYNISTLNFTATDVSLDKCWYILNGGENITIDCSFNITHLGSQEGLNELHLFANDSDGNIGADFVFFSVDTTPPSLRIINPENNSYYPENILFNISGSENLDYCIFSLDDWLTNYTMNRYNLTDFSYVLNSISTGVYNAKFWCNDTMGNINSTENIYFSAYYPNIILDLIYPTSPIEVPRLSSFNFTVNVSCEIVDCGIVNVTLDPLENWWDESWNYRKSLNLSGIGTELTDFQINISINLTEDYMLGKVNSDCSDIRFTNSTSSEISYWTESCYINGSNSIFWIKVPSISSSGNTTLFMYYGNTAALNVSNGTKTFDYFDSGDNIGSWTIVNSAGQTSTQGLPQPSYYAVSTNGNYMYKNIGLTTNRIIEYNSRSDGLGNLFFLTNSAGSGQHMRLETRTGQNTGIGSATAWSSWAAPSQTCSNLATNTWFNFRLVIGSTTAQSYVNDVACGGSYTFSNNGEYIGLVGDALGGTYTTWWDNLRVRKYSPTTPSYFLGNEENKAKGIISANIGDIPFFADENPKTTISLKKGESQIITFIVNATGSSKTYEFFTFANLVKNSSITNSSSKVNVTIFSSIVSLIYPDNSYNFSDFTIPFFNFSINEGEFTNCQLFGSWGGWGVKQTINNPSSNITLNFSSENVGDDGTYFWNVKCIDNYGGSITSAINFTFSTFLFPDYVNSSSINISQSKSDGNGEIYLNWEQANHSDYYRIYYTDNLTIEFSLLAQTNETNYTDRTANSTRRRFYKISSWNPTGENFSEITLGKTVYYLKRKPEVDTKNWVGFYLENGNLTDAHQAFQQISNITAFTMWNSSNQKRVTCNEFSCPVFPSCTDTNCNFILEDGTGYEASLNTSSPVFTNWSLVGKLKDKSNVSLIVNMTSLTQLSKNWISIFANSSLKDAHSLITSIPYSDALTNWNELNQVSEGYIQNKYSPLPPYFGINFILEPEKGYEVSVTQNSLYTQS